MRRDAVGEPGCLSPRPCTVDELAIDVERVYVARWPHALGELDGGVTRPAPEISDHLSRADIRGRVEGLSGRGPLIHGLVARQALRTDVEPVLQKHVLVRHD